MQIKIGTPVIFRFTGRCLVLKHFHSCWGTDGKCMCVTGTSAVRKKGKFHGAMGKADILKSDGSGFKPCLCFLLGAVTLRSCLKTYSFSFLVCKRG